MNMPLKAPFPWFGGKSRVASLVWERFGKVCNFVEPFFGSGAVLLGRPDWNPEMIETGNDKDSLLCNFFRALQADPEAVAEHAHWPCNESDLHARNYYLLTQRETLRARIEGHPEFYDAKLAGWWVWGIGLWIGGGFATNCGPWASVDGLFVNTGKAGGGIKRSALATGLPEQQGVWRCLPHLSSSGQGVHREKRLEDLIDWFAALAHRLKSVRMSCGDWKRVLGPCVTTNYGLTAVFLDPPYDLDDFDDRCYAHDDNDWMEVCTWAVENGENPLLRIALCGYEGPAGDRLKKAGWKKVAWKSQGGYGGGMGQRGDTNRDRERIWFSPACVTPGIENPLPTDVPGQLLLGGSL